MSFLRDSVISLRGKNLGHGEKESVGEPSQGKNPELNFLSFKGKKPGILKKEEKPGILKKEDFSQAPF